MSDELKRSLGEMAKLSERLKFELEAAQECAVAFNQWFEQGKQMQVEIDRLTVAFQDTLSRWGKVRDKLQKHLDDDMDSADWWKVWSARKALNAHSRQSASIP